MSRVAEYSTSGNNRKSTYSDSLTKREHYDILRSQLWMERASFDDHWRDLADHFLPRRVRFLTSDKNKGDKRNMKIIDNVGVIAARTLRSGLHAGITSPARPWMRLSTPDPDLAEFGPVKAWLHTVTQRMLTVFIKSNLYNALPIVYGDMGVFASSAMAVLDDEKDLFRCYTYPLGSFAMAVNGRGIVDTFVREYRMTVHQVVTTFGYDNNRRSGSIDWDRFSRAVKNLWDAGSYQSEVEVCWYVEPNVNADPSRVGSRYMPFSSCWFEKGQEGAETFLRESGFLEFPILAPRWDVTGEDVYGTDSPGMSALGDTRALQKLQKVKASTQERQLNPPLQAPMFMQSRGISLLPGEINYLDVRDGQQGIRSVYETNFSVQDALQDVFDHRDRINKAFYADLFLMLASSPAQTTQRTAREIEERHEEKLLALGPVLERTNDELLDPLVDRVFAMMDRRGLIPTPPEELDGVDLKVEYISLMAQAQRLVGIVGLDRFFMSVGPIAQQYPEARHKVNALQAVDDYGSILDINPQIVRPDDEANAAMAAEQQAMAAQQQAAVQNQQAQTAQTLSQTPLEGDSALSRLAEGRI